MATSNTHREQLEAYDARLREEVERFESHTKAVGDFLREMYAIMIDPVEDGSGIVGETCKLLIEAAKRDRDIIAACHCHPDRRSAPTSKDFPR